MKIDKRIAQVGAVLLLLFGFFVMGCPAGEEEVEKLIPPPLEPEVLDRIEVVSLPDQTVYILGKGESFTTEGLYVFAFYTQGQNERRARIPNGELDISSPNLSSAGSKTVTVNWKGQSTSFTVRVGTPPDSISVEGQLKNKFYVVNEPIDFTGLTIKAVYGNEEKTIDPDDPLLLGRVMIPSKASYQPDEEPEDVDSSMSVPGPKKLVVDYLGVVVEPEEPQEDEEPQELVLEIIVFGHEDLKKIALEMAAISGNGSTSNPTRVKLPRTIKNLDMQYTADILDPLGALYIALQGKYVHLDLSEIGVIVNDEGRNVIGVPGSSNAAFNYRHSNPTANPYIPPSRWPSRIVRLDLSPEIAVIGPFAFSDNSSMRGSTLDLSGLSKLRIIGERAFNVCGLRGIDFTGCTSLYDIKNYAFYGNGIEMLDLSPCTSLYSISNHAFYTVISLKYVELPPNLVSVSDQAFDLMQDLKYVRFRSEAPKISLGWRNWYAVAQNSVPPAVHPLAGMDTPWTTASMKNFLFFYPRTFSWTGNWGGGYMFHQHEGRDDITAHFVPLPYSGNPDKVYGIDANGVDIDKLRGQELLDYNDGMLRGQPTVTIDTNQVQDRYKGKGYKVKTNIEGWEFDLDGDKHTFGSPPPSQLRRAIPDNVMDITGLQAWENYKNYPGVEFSRISVWGGPGETGAGVLGGRRGAMGRPVIFPDDVSGDGYPNFVFLTMEVYDSSGKPEGYLDRWGKSTYTRARTLTIEDVRVARWVYVDKNCTFFNNQVLGRKVWLELKKGWNLIEVKEPYEYDTDKEASTLNDTKDLSLPRPAMNIWISSGLILDSSKGKPDILGPGPNFDTTRTFFIDSVEMPWRVTQVDAWKSIVSSAMPKKLGNPPELLELLPPKPAFPEAGYTTGGVIPPPPEGDKWEDWMLLSRKHLWRNILE